MPSQLCYDIEWTNKGQNNNNHIIKYSYNNVSNVCRAHTRYMIS